MTRLQALASSLMKDWLSRTQTRQRPMLAVYAGLLILIAVIIGLAALKWLTSGSSDRLAVIGNLLSLGTLLLALVAGIVALAAYSAATGRPDLKVRFIPSIGTYNRVMFTQDENGYASGNTTVTLAVRNYSTYAARSPAVLIEFEDGLIPGELYAESREWTRVNDARSRYVIAVQWDGGPSYSIHGNSTRFLPELHLRGLYAMPKGKLRIAIRLLADGYSRRDVILPVEFTDNPGRVPPEIPPRWL